MDCIFCKIINKELDSYKIFENDDVYSFLDIAEDVDGHILLVPKKHYKNIFDIEEKELEKLMHALKNITSELRKKGYSGVNIMNASGKDAGQTVDHFHIHIIPRKEDDKLASFPKYNGAKESLETMHKKLKIN